MDYKHIIDEATLLLLKKLINLRIDCIYSDGLSVQDNRIEAQRFALRINDKLWLNIKNKAKETFEDNDYYELNITKSEFPEGLKYDKVHNAIVYPFGKIKLKPVIIKSVEIYNRHEIYDDEELYYDVLLIFNCRNHFKFMICLEERVDEFLVYSSDQQIINTYLNGLKLRATL